MPRGPINWAKPKTEVPPKQQTNALSVLALVVLPFQCMAESGYLIAVVAAAVVFFLMFISMLIVP